MHHISLISRDYELLDGCLHAGYAYQLFTIISESNKPALIRIMSSTPKVQVFRDAANSRAVNVKKGAWVCKSTSGHVRGQGRVLLWQLTLCWRAVTRLCMTEMRSPRSDRPSCKAVLWTRKPSTKAATDPSGDFSSSHPPQKPFTAGWYIKDEEAEDATFTNWPNCEWKYVVEGEWQCVCLPISLVLSGRLNQTRQERGGEAVY
jgi:hypothetical protein